MFKKLFVLVASLFMFFAVAYAQKKTVAVPTSNEYSVQEAARKLLAGNFDIDPAHTRVSFIVPHLMISEVEGRFDDVKGSFTIGKTFLESKFNATVPVASINTGIKQRDNHLKSADFFDVEKFPEMTFESKSITGTLDNFKMVAALTIKGVTKDVLFSGAYTGAVKNPQGKEVVGLKATAKINRNDFNINYNGRFDLGPVVGESVEIRLWAEGVKK